MKVRIIDSFLNLGGGERFLAQMVQGLCRNSEDVELELCGSLSSLPGLTRIAQASPRPVKVLLLSRFSMLPAGPFLRLHRFAKATAWLRRKLGWGGWTFQLPRGPFNRCDLVWLPWAMRHRLPALAAEQEARVLATFHDTILLDFAGLLPPDLWAEEIETSRRWMQSGAHLLFTSDTTLRLLEGRFGPRSDGCHLIRLAAEHQALHGEVDLGILSRLPKEYLLCPANISPHKNHEVLLKGLAPLRNRCPLVLTGFGTALDQRSGRAADLLKLAEGLGYVVGKDLFPLGYVSEVTYEAILLGATMLVMPTLGEGGGSWPVSEALLQGKPTVVSDIPVMKEFAKAFEVSGILWFDPYTPASLEQVVQGALENLEAVQEASRTQGHTKLLRSWNEVASDYLQLFLELGKSKAQNMKSAPMERL